MTTAPTNKDKDDDEDCGRARYTKAAASRSEEK